MSLPVACHSGYCQLSPVALAHSSIFLRFGLRLSVSQVTEAHTYIGTPIFGGIRTRRALFASHCLTLLHMLLFVSLPHFSALRDYIEAKHQSNNRRRFRIVPIVFPQPLSCPPAHNLAPPLITPTPQPAAAFLLSPLVSYRASQRSIAAHFN